MAKYFHVFKTCETSLGGQVSDIHNFGVSKSMDVMPRGRLLAICLYDICASFRHRIHSSHGVANADHREDAGVTDS